MSIFSPRAAEIKHGGLYFLPLFLICNNLNDSCQNNLKIYGTDFRQISTVGRTMAVDDQAEINFRSLKDVAMATNFVVFNFLSTELIFLTPQQCLVGVCLPSPSTQSSLQMFSKGGQAGMTQTRRSANTTGRATSPAMSNAGLIVCSARR